MKVADDLPRKAQQRYRQLLDGAHGLTDRHDDRIPTDGPGAGMSRAPRVGNRDTGSKLLGQELVGDLRHHWQFATLQVIGAFGIHDNAIDPIDRDDRGIVRQSPERDPLECCGIRCRIRIDQHQAAEQRLRFCRRHADMDAGFSGGCAGGRHPALRTAPGNHGDCLFRRNGGIGATNAIRRQIREIDRDNPCHRTPLRETQHIHPLSRASVPATIGAFRHQALAAPPTA